jgi:hypothetical protein
VRSGNRRLGRGDAATGSLVCEHSIAVADLFDCVMSSDEARRKFSAPMFPDGFAGVVAR